MAKKGNRIQVILECNKAQDFWSSWNISLHYKKQKKILQID